MKSVYKNLLEQISVDPTNSEATEKILDEFVKEIRKMERLETLYVLRKILKKRSQKDFTLHPTEYSDGKQAYSTFVFRMIDDLTVKTVEGKS